MPSPHPDILFLFQFACCLVTGMLGLMLIISRFQIHWKYKGYETSRCLLASGMFLLCIHFALQLIFGIRAMGDDAGAAFNMLFYTPTSFLISYAIYNIEGYIPGKKRFQAVGLLSNIVVYAAFAVGFTQTRNLCIGNTVYVMFAAFMLSLAYYIVCNTRAMIVRHHRIETLSGAYMLPYNQYTWGSFTLLCVTAVIIGLSLFSRYLILIAGPLILVALFAFIMVFIGLGNHIMPIADILSEEETTEETNSLGNTANEASPETTRLSVQNEGCLTQERMTEIENTLKNWCSSGGFRDNAANIILLSKDTGIRKEELSLFFDQKRHSNFRIWLCDVRIKEAQRMIISSSETRPSHIATECGFTSYEHLCTEFKKRTRLTPEEWRAKYTVG